MRLDAVAKKLVLSFEQKYKNASVIELKKLNVLWKKGFVNNEKYVNKESVEEVLKSVDILLFTENTLIQRLSNVLLSHLCIYYPDAVLVHYNSSYLSQYISYELKDITFFYTVITHIYDISPHDQRTMLLKTASSYLAIHTSNNTINTTPAIRIIVLQLSIKFPSIVNERYRTDVYIRWLIEISSPEQHPIYRELLINAITQEWPQETTLVLRNILLLLMNEEIEISSNHLIGLEYLIDVMPRYTLTDISFILCEFSAIQNDGFYTSALKTLLHWSTTMHNYCSLWLELWKAMNNMGKGRLLACITPFLISILLDIIKDKHINNDILELLRFSFLGFHENKILYDHIIGDIVLLLNYWKKMTYMNDNDDDDNNYMNNKILFGDVCHALIYYKTSQKQERQSWSELENILVNDLKWKKPTEQTMITLLNVYKVNVQTQSNTHQNNTVGLLGLYNIGNTCFLNALIQALYSNDEAISCFISLDLYKYNNKNNNDKNNNDNDNKSFHILLSLQNLFKKMKHNQQQQNAISPVLLYKSLPEYLQGYKQQDSAECLKVILDSWSSIDDKNDNKNDLFHGIILNSIECLSCHNKNNAKSTFNELSLSFPLLPSNPSNHNLNNMKLETMINEYFKSETLDKDNLYYCSECKRKVQQAEKTSQILFAPQTLVICLKRYQYNIKTQKRTKICTRVDYPELLFITEYKKQQQHRICYLLYAVVIHSGHSSIAGHYFTIARSSERAKDQFKEMIMKLDDMEEQMMRNAAKKAACYDRWIHYNDDVVSFFEYNKLNEMVRMFPHDTPYILFYERCEL